MNPSQRTILVTGSSRGIGRAIAARLARDGVRVVAHYGSAEAEAASLATEAAGAGHDIVPVKADLADIDAVKALVDTVIAATPNGLDGIVHNAGVLATGPFEETSASELDRLYAVNVRAPFLLTQHLSPHLNPDSAILFISSVVAQRHYDRLTAYGMSKAAIDGLALQLAGHFGPRGIRVNVIAPGAIKTDMQPRLGDPSAIAAVQERQALKRVGEPEDVADAVAILMSRDARWVTGVNLAVSGGTRL